MSQTNPERGKAATNKPIAVVKVGGDMLLERQDRRGLARNIHDLVENGWSCVLLHGGGPQLNALQELHGLTPRKIDGRRITGEEDLKVVKQALCGEVNVDLVSALLAERVPAFGCHGASGVLIEAEKRPPMDFATKGFIDFGEVGDVVSINTDLIMTLLNAGQVPVIASLGVNRGGRVFNINADTTVSAIAKALEAKLLILSTRVGGIFKDIKDPKTRVDSINAQTANELISQGVITDGMIPKVEESMALLDQGVGEIVIMNASTSGAFLSASRGGDEFGTRFVRTITP